MASPLYPQSAVIINTGTLPDDFMGPRALPYTNVVLVGGTPYQIDLHREISLGQIDQVQALYVDNYSNTAALIITLDWQRLVVPIAAQGVFPVLTKNPQNVVFSSSAGATIQFAFLNVPVPFAVWK